MYYVWNQDSSSGKTYTEGRVVHPEKIDFPARNRELRAENPEWQGRFPATMESEGAYVEVYSSAKPADFFTASGHWIVSERLKCVLDQFPDLGIRLFPIPVHYRRETYPEPYWELSIQEAADPVDYERTVLDTSGTTVNVRSLVLDASRAEGRILFNVEKLNLVLAHHDLAQAVLDAGCIGVEFVRSEAYYSLYYFADDRKQRILSPTRKTKSARAAAPKPSLTVTRGKLESYPLPPAVASLLEGRVDEWARRCRFHSPGRLRVTGGRVSGCDPWEAGTAVPFSMEVADREYAVFLGEAVEERRIAAAGLLFSTAPVARWRRESAPQALGEAGIGVDSGDACLLSWSAHAALLDSLAIESFEEKLEAELEKRRTGSWSWAPLSTEKSGLDAVVFSAGYGDGVYPAYWALDAEDRPVCLLVDFGVLGLQVPAE